MKRFTLLLLAVACYVFPVSGQEKVKEQLETFDLAREAWVELSCKYGDIHVETWDQPKAEVRVWVSAEGQRDEDVDKMLEKVQIAIRGDASGIVVDANLEDIIQMNNVSGDRNNRLRIKFKDGSRITLDAFSIRYEVKMPASNHLKVANKYGDLYVSRLTGNAEIWLKYGEMRAQELSGDCKLDLGYAKGRLEKMGHADLIVKYSEVSIDEATSLRLESRYSTFDLGAIDTLLSESKYNNINIGAVSFLGLLERHTDVKVDYLGDLGNVKMEYGNCKINRLDQKFSQLYLEGEYADFYVDLEDEASFDFDLSTKYGDVSYPRAVSVSKKQIENNAKKIVGKMGDKAGGKLTVITKYGDVVIK